MIPVYSTVWTALVVFAVIFFSNVCAKDARLIQTLEDDIGAENFTYYRLQRPGSLRLELISLKGDVDIYVSSTVSQPDYWNYDLKSETCGLDVISIPTNMPRPVHLALFGHPNSFVSRYRLSIYEVDDPAVDDYEALVDKYERYYYEEMNGGSYEPPTERETSSKSSSSKAQKADHRAEVELPLWMNILIDTLKFIIEVIL
ncbi:unnamed protein product [Candidula unifasciata]|uniref:Uncharacterized protein n=1 Tax=Candidula unifasciata TaxID=100452 RepID=A0A8S3ZHS7_9EUPU|nr:unnamed protein product [Candidula unifasciata]